MITENSTENRKVDKKTALALWETTVPPPVLRKKRIDENDEDGDVDAENKEGIMKFTLFTKRGNKQQVMCLAIYLRTLLIFIPQTRQLAIPAQSALAIQTRTAQMQDKVEQQQLKRLVLNYEQREEAEELKGKSQCCLIGLWLISFHSS